MTLDKSLRVRRGLVRSRSVLSRAERLTRLKESERWQEGQSPLGLPKVRVLRLTVKKKKAAKKAEEGAEGTAAAAAAPAAAPAADTKAKDKGKGKEKGKGK